MSAGSFVFAARALALANAMLASSTALRVLAEFPKLGLRILVKGRDSDIKACSLHRFSFDVIKRAPQLGSGDSFRRQGWDRLKGAIEEALALGCTDAAAVRHLASADELNRPRSEPFPLGALECYDRPLPQMQEYDLLLGNDATAEMAR
jgi:hypothetical protein